MRQRLLTSADAAAITATLEHLGTGRIVELRDSITKFHTGGTPTPAAEWFTHNFWTTEPIESGATYTVTVTDPDRLPASMTVAVPHDFSVTLSYWRYSGFPASLGTDNVEHLGLVIGRLHPDSLCAAPLGLTYPPHPYAIPAPVSPDVYELRVYPVLPDERSLLCPIVKRDFLIAS